MFGKIARLFALLVLLLAALPCRAQNFTNVTGTITDPAGVPYANCSITAEVVPAGTNPTIGGAGISGLNRGSCDANGAFTMTLGSNAVILPGGTQWKFTINETGTPPPLGTGAQSCTATLTISGASQSIASSFSCPALGRSGSIVNAGTAIDATSPKYNLQYGRFVLDATFTNGQNTISCGANDCNFSISQNGQICFGTNLGNDASGESSTVILPQGTLTVTGAQTATCSGGNATASCTPANRVGCAFVWGPDASVALNSAWTDTIASCGTLLLPSAVMLIQSAEFNASNPTCGIALFVSTSSAVVGWSATTTTLIPTPSFNAASCTGGDGTGCLFSSAGITVQNLQVFGAGVNYGGGAGFNGKTAVEEYGGAFNANSLFMNVQLLDWGANTTGFTGLAWLNQSDASAVNVRNDTFGNPNCKVNLAGGNAGQNVVQVFGQYCAGSNTNGLLVQSGVLVSHAGVYGVSNPTPGTIANSVIVSGGAKFYSYGDVFPYSIGAAGSAAELNVNGAGSLAYLSGDVIVNPQTGSVNGVSVSTGGTIIADGTTISTAAFNGTGAGLGAVVVGATGTFISRGGNTITGGASGTAVNLTSSTGTYESNPTDTLTGGISTIQPTLAVTGFGTSPTITILNGSANERGSVNITAGTTPAASGTWTLTFAGTLAGPTGNAPVCTWNFSDAGTAWNARASVHQNATRTTTTNGQNWDNNAVALTATNTYQLNWTCAQ